MHTQSVELAADLVIQVASIPCLFAIKCLAWKERHTRPNGSKDAEDVWTMLSAYERTPPSNFDLMYDKHITVLEVVEHNMDYALAWLLGHDIRNSLDATSLSLLRAFFGNETVLLTFARHMTRYQVNNESLEQEALTRLKWLDRGIGDY